MTGSLGVKELDQLQFTSKELNKLSSLMTETQKSL